MKDMIELLCAMLYSIILPLVSKKPRRIVLYYHSVKKGNVENFEKQMAYLAIKNCTVKVSEIVNGHPVAPGDVIVALTFDDAFVSVCQYGLPILEKYGLSAAIFVPTGNLGKRPMWDLEEDCQDVDEVVIGKESIVEIDKAGYEIFSHTVSHSVLTEVESDQLQKELVRSKESLESIVGHEVEGISYPHGAFNSQVCKEAQKVGYKYGFSVEPSLVNTSTDNFQIGRFQVSAGDNMLKFRLKAMGAYQVVKYLRMLKRKIVKV